MSMNLVKHISVGIVVIVITVVTIASALFLRPDVLSSHRNERSAESQDSASLASSIAAGCPEDQERQGCLEKAVLALVPQYGPVESIGAMTVLVHDGIMHGRGDYHDFVHRIGRLTAKKTGLNPDGFFLCPVDYNYGCQHGFFEAALVEEPDAVRAADMVCDENLMKDKPLKFLFYCYHGVGHGVMMAKAYDLQASLKICDEFPQTLQKDGCQQGVFMEGVVGYMNGTARREGVFSETDRLAPCNQLEERFQYQCYINMGGYLAGVAGTGSGAVERATSPCLQAGPTHIRTCLMSVGLTSTNPGWQRALAPVFSHDFIQDAVSICAHFPKAYEGDCIEAGVQNIAQFDRGDTTRMVKFCSAVEEQFRSQCFTRIGNVVRDELPAGTSAETMCLGVPEDYHGLCMNGVNL